MKKYTVECISFIRYMWYYPPQYFTNVEKVDVFADSAIDAARKASERHPDCSEFQVIVGDSKEGAK